MSSNETAAATRRTPPAADGWASIGPVGTTILAVLTAFIVGALIIWLTSGQFQTVLKAYGGLADGALFKPRGLSESLIASVPYILAGLAVAVGFKAGLFNIGAEGQFYIGAMGAVWAGYALTGLPAIVHLPLALCAAAAFAALWAAIPGYLKARTGAHEVITTMMMNYIAFRLTEYMVTNHMKDVASTVPKSPDVAPTAELWRFWEIPARVSDPLNALLAATVIGLAAFFLARWITGLPGICRRFGTDRRRRIAVYGFGLLVGLVSFLALPAVTRAWWPFVDEKDRLHSGLLLAVAMAILVWWLLSRTTIGFELRTIGANPAAARYAGINVSRNIVLAMAISGALAGLAGAVEILGLEHNLPISFSSGYGWDSIAVALVAQNNPFGIILAAFMFGGMRNGADLMELRSGVSKYVISLIQALMLLFVATPEMIRWLYRLRAERRLEEQAPLTRGWGG